MGTINSPAENGHAAENQNGQELGLMNELRLLDCIKTQGWIRETEAALICGMSQYMVGQVSRRLAVRGEIFRDRPFGNAGFFLRLKAAGADRIDGRSGKDVIVPQSWRHDALAIQTLGYLSYWLGCGFETESAIRHSGKTSKIPDGNIIDDETHYPLEQEFSRKSGPNLRKQSIEIAKLAATGIDCFVAYPYPACFCGGVDHELRQINSLRPYCSHSAATHIKLVRCHFASHLAFLNMQATRFELLELPEVNQISAAPESAHHSQQARHFDRLRWENQEVRQAGEPHKVLARLFLDGAEIMNCVFVESDSVDEAHYMANSSYGTEYCRDENLPFADFVKQQQQAILENEEGELRMLSMSEQRAASLGLS
ncbi:MAG: hypothetical protein KJ850_08845 [Gammaproteobacteria bacterium]|nr:hypothetical protein [Gammaproteobacteria bacterium]MBU1625144.1 hypothetical protein [Gammaproteobacteria bacterium]MBU1981404.1 hypothetical protein [Gammaproteobacteria bacterium]